MKTPTPLPTQEYLRYNFYYNPETGKMYARFPSKQHKIGRLGAINKEGYRQRKINQVYYYEHRLVWMYVYGEEPTTGIDHEDRDRLNNKISNLRKATNSNNGGNRLCKGITWDKQAQKWRASITFQGRKKSLGFFHTKQEARDTYIAAHIELHGEFSPYQTN